MSARRWTRSEEHTSELQSRLHLVCRLLLEKKKSRWLRCRQARREASPSLGGRRHKRSRLAGRRPPWPRARRRLFFFNDPPTTEIYTLSLHDALPISPLD